MVTFFKDFNYSAELAKMKSRFNNSLYKYGLVGEERVAYQLKKCRLDILCAYNIRLNIDGNKCQFDFIVICGGKIIILEVKNLLGNIIFNKNGNTIREINKNGIIERSSMDNPFIQIDSHISNLKNFLNSLGYNKDIIGILVMANDKMAIINECEDKIVIKYDELNKYINNISKGLKNTYEDFTIMNLIVDKDIEYNYNMVNIIKDNINRQYVPKFQNIEDKELYVKLIRLRYDLHIKYNIPTCNIFTNRDAEELVKNKPKTKEEFILVKGFKERKYNMYGKEIINIFKKFD